MARVDWTGQRFLLALAPGASAGKVGTSAADALGEGASVLEAQETRAAVTAFRGGESWMRSGETVRLSRHEASVLAERHGKEAAAELGLDDVARNKLIACIERELTAAFERVHQGSGASALAPELSKAADRILEASRSFLDAEQQKGLEELLAQFHR